MSAPDDNMHNQGPTQEELDRLGFTASFAPGNRDDADVGEAVLSLNVALTKTAPCLGEEMFEYVKQRLLKGDFKIDMSPGPLEEGELIITMKIQGVIPETQDTVLGSQLLLTRKVGIDEKVREEINGR